MSDQESPRDIRFARVARSRASKACLACRARKVRCDVVHRDGQCTNCVLDKRQCIVKSRPSKYRPSKKKRSALQDNPPTDSFQEQQQQQQERQERPRFLSEGSSSSPAEEITVSLDRSTERSTEPTQHNRLLGSSDLWDLTVDHDNDDISETNHPEIRDRATRAIPIAPNNGNDDSDPNKSRHGFLDQAHVIYSYYPFLEVDLSLLSELDAQFLEAQGCFKAPCRQAADEFMREYFLHVHPNLPLLDESVFWNMYHRNGYATQNGRTSFSLFLFQAMLFASCSFMSLNTIRSLGFTSLRDARDTYYRRAKLLFDFCGETSPVANAQGALLLSYNATMRYQKRINSIWLVTAIQLAQAAGAHRFYLKQDQDPEVKNVLKRLWWCCIVRDRILPLGVRRHLYIPLVDFDPDKAALTEDDFAHEIGFSRVYDAETKRSLIRLFITLCDLAVALTDVITTVYATGQPLDVRFLSDLKLQQTVSCIQSSKIGLDAWFERASVRFPAPAGMMSTNKSLVLYTNLMYIYYHSARLALCQYEALILSTGSIRLEDEYSTLRQTRIQLEDGATGITDNLKELIQLKLGTYLPISIVAYAALPLVLHILDVKLSTKASQTAQKQGRLNVYMEAMRGFQTQYDGVDDVWGIIRKALEFSTLEHSAQEQTDSNLVNGSVSKHSDLTHTYSSKGLEPITPASGWGHLFLQQPALYFRLVQTIDLSLSMGRYSENSLFPLSPKSARFPLCRLLMGDTDDRGRSNQDHDSTRYSNPYAMFQNGNLDLEGHKDISDQPAPTMQIPNELGGPTNLDLGLDDLPIPLFLDGLEFGVDERETNMLAAFSFP